MVTSVSIEASGLTKRFGEVIAVKDLSLSVQAGEIYGFLGLNGAGKTTTIRMLLGMIKPSVGSVSLFGTRIQPGERSIWQRVRYFVETPHAYPDLTVRQNLELYVDVRKISQCSAVDAIMERLGLTQYAGRHARNLSLGNTQRLGCGQSTHWCIPICLSWMSEPTDFGPCLDRLNIKEPLPRAGQKDRGYRLHIEPYPWQGGTTGVENRDRA